MLGNISTAPVFVVTEFKDIHSFRIMCLYFFSLQKCQVDFACAHALSDSF